MKTMTVLPPIAIPGDEHQRLQTIAEAALRTSPHSARFLLDELNRAAVSTRLNRRTVRMGVPVVFRDHSSGRDRRVRVVYPGEADPAAGRISVLTPVGAALVGLGEGQSMEWHDRRGNRRMLRVLRIEDDIEPAGYFDT